MNDPVISESTAEEDALFDAMREEELRAGADEPEDIESEAEASEPENDPEPENEPERDADTPKKPPAGYVDIGALHEERKERQRVQQEAQELRASLAQFELLRQQLAEHRMQQQQQQQELSSREAEEAYQNDPVAYLRQQNERLVSEIDSIRQNQQHFAQTQQRAAEEAAYMQQVTNLVVERENQFRQSQPDYDDAFRFVQERRLSEYDIMGFRDQQEKSRNFYQEVLGLSTKALGEGRNPAEIIYELAKVWGYRSGNSTNSDQERASARIDTLKRGGKVATSLSESAGKPEREFNLADIERMSDDDFDKLWDSMERGSR